MIYIESSLVHLNGSTLVGNYTPSKLEKKLINLFVMTIKETLAADNQDFASQNWPCQVQYTAQAGSKM